MFADFWVVFCCLLGCIIFGRMIFHALWRRRFFFALPHTKATGIYDYKEEKLSFIIALFLSVVFFLIFLIFGLTVLQFALELDCNIFNGEPLRRDVVC